MACERIVPGDMEQLQRMRAMFGPQQVDQEIRQAIRFCWMALPPERQNVDEVERLIRQLFERAIRDFRDDANSFGIGTVK